MLMIFGANGPSGRQLIHQLDRLERETAVAALRLPEQQADEFFANHHIRTTVADTLDAEAVAQAVQQYRPDTVVSFVGGKNEQGIRSDAIGNLHIIRALEQHAPEAHFIPLAWTILRPCGLANGDDTAYQLYEQLPAIPRQYMTRTALAAAVRQIIDEDGHEGKAYSVTSGNA